MIAEQFDTIQSSQAKDLPMFFDVTTKIRTLFFFQYSCASGARRPGGKKVIRLFLTSSSV